MQELPEGFSVLRIIPEVFEYCYLSGEDRRTLHNARGQYIVAEMTDRGHMFYMESIAGSQSDSVSRFFANYKEA